VAAAPALAAVALAGTAVAGVIGTTSTASAGYVLGDRTVGLKIKWELPEHTHVHVTEGPSNCAKDVTVPGPYTTPAPRSEYGTGYSFHWMFVAKATGSCATDASNARFHFRLVGPTTTEGSVTVLIAQPRAGAQYAAYCDGPVDVKCTSGGEITGNTRNLTVTMAIGPFTSPAGPGNGYTFCAPEGGTCAGGWKANVAFGAGRHGAYVYAPSHDAPGYGGSRTPCTLATFATKDPAPGRQKACFYKNP